MISLLARYSLKSGETDSTVRTDGTQGTDRTEGCRRFPVLSSLMLRRADDASKTLKWMLASERAFLLS